MKPESILGRTIRLVPNPTIPEIIGTFNELPCPAFTELQAKNLISFFNANKIELVINRNRESPLYTFFLNKKEFAPISAIELEIILISQLERLGFASNIVYSVYKSELVPILTNFLLHVESE